ncbi:neuropeptide F [Andrena cerasifolii]|uniref:neuropeptide F n=1 Tax=Andrena cerasifolii TaxID=2819439 RepID=UPI00403765FE
MRSYLNTICLPLVIFILGAVIVDGEPEPMAGPTRPEVFTTPEELRRYLDYVGDYYLQNGKARYGKRGDVPFPTSDAGRAWDTVKTILDASRQSRQQRFDTRKQEKSRFLRELESSGDQKHALRSDGRPCRVLHIVEKYYDDAQ